VLFLTFSWMAAPFRTLLYVMVFLIGAFVGMEVPLVMRALNARQTAFNELVSKVLTFDYLGALAVSLLFPLVLAPYLGLVRTGFPVRDAECRRGPVDNQGVFHRAEKCHRPLAARLRRDVRLVFGFAFADKLTYWGEHGLFGDEIVFATTTPYQRLVITKWKDDTRLYINGNLQFSSRDEYRYHEALVHPVLQPMPWAKRVLVLGGGDGLALREILRYPNIEHVTLVDLDPAMTAPSRSARNWSSSITARSATSACAW
jgi:spermidine synthase